MTDTGKKGIYMFFIMLLIMAMHIMLIYGIYYYSSSPQEELSQQPNKAPETAIRDRLENRQVYNSCVDSVSNNDGSYDYKDLNECLASNSYETPAEAGIDIKVKYPKATEEDRERFKKNVRENANRSSFDEQFNAIILDKCYRSTIRYSDTITYTNELLRCLENKGYIK